MADTDAPGGGAPPAALHAETPPAVGEMPLATDAPAARGSSGRRWLIIGGIALVFVLLIGYVIGGAVAAAGAVGSADKALEGTIKHQDTVISTLGADPFKNIDFKSGNPDVPAARTALAGYEQKLSQSAALVAADRAALERARPNLQSSLFTLPEQATFNRDRTRIAAALSALDSAQKGLDLYRKQAVFVKPLLDAFAGFEAISQAANASDLAGTQAQLPATGANVQKAIDLALPPAIPALWMPALKALQQLVNDMQGLITAAQANDQAGFTKYSSAIDADSKVLTGFDQTAVDNADTALFQPLIDSYNTQMKVAAGG